MQNSAALGCAGEAQLRHEERVMVMALGFNYSTGGDGSDIVPYVKYDARAGRFFRNDRIEH
jgi:hypothetical protein